LWISDTLAKTQQMSAQSLQEATVKTVESKMKQSFQYLHELLKQLSVLKPVNPLNFSVPGIVELKNLQYVDSFIDNRKKRINDLEVMDITTFYIKWGSGNKITLERDMPAPAQKIREGLNQFAVKYAEEEMRSPRGTIAGWRFLIDQAINTDVRIKADHEQPRLLISARNLIRLGTDEFVVPAEDITEAWLEEFAKTLLGQMSAFTKYRVQTPLR